MTEIGFIHEIKGGITTIRVAKKTACGENCASCKGGCKPGERILEVKNPIGAKEGERVLLELPEARLLSAAFLAYILPLVLFIAGFAITGAFVKAELVQILGGVIFGATGLLPARIINSKNKEKYMAEVVRVME